MKATVVFAAILGMLVLLAGCGSSPIVAAPGAPATPTAAPGPGDLAAAVNGHPIAVALFQAQLQAATASLARQPGVAAGSADVQAALRQQVLQLLIDQALVDQAAEAMGIRIDDAQVEAEVERIRSGTQGSFADWLAANGYSEGTFRAQTRSDLLGAAVRERVTGGVPTTCEQVHLRQILVESEAQARALLDSLAKGQAGFEALAQEHSVDEATRATGGDMGYVPRGLLPLAVEQAAFALAPGQTSGPLQGPLGWHIIRLEALEPARDVPPELLNALRHEAFMQWLDEERAKAVVERYVQ